MYQSQAQRLVAFLLLLLPLFSLFSCKQSDDFLAWNTPPISFVGEYEENGVRFTACFSAEGNTRTVVILSPEASKGLTYQLKNDIVTVAYENVTEQLDTIPAPLARFLLLYPENAVLSEVTRDGNARLVHVIGDGGSYCYRFETDRLPTLVTAETKEGHLSLHIHDAHAE